jgi:alpha-glucosidase
MSRLAKWMKKGYRRAGEVLGQEERDRRLLVSADAGSFLLSSPMPQVLRIGSGRGGVFPEDRSFAVACSPETAVAPALADNAERLEADFQGLKIVIARKPLALSVYDRDGTLLLRDHPRAGLGWTDAGFLFSSIIEPGARYYGFGEKTGRLDKTGKALTMWASDLPYTVNYDPLYVSIPWALVLREGRAFGLFFDEPGRSHFDLGRSEFDLMAYHLEEGELNLYVIAGPEVGAVLERYTALTGRMPLPPRWALGHHQCRWSYMNEAEVRKVAQEFRDRDLPSDVIYLDVHYMDRYRVFTFDANRFPEPKRLTDDLARIGFRAVTAVDPGVHAAEDFPLYREGREQGLFCRDEKGGEYNSRVWPGKVAFPDFTNPAARAWWGRAHRPLVEAGVAGIWNDMNEPSSWKLDLRVKEAVLPLWPVRRPPIVHHDEGRQTPHLRLRNVYALLENQGTRAGLEELRPGVRPFILTRSGYAGIQRYAAVWTGDNSSSFAHLALTLPMLLNLGLSGVALVGPDIGGFMWSCSPELYARWIQLGAFYPFCRTHTALRSRRQEPWSFGKEVERIARQYLKLRYRLHPTLYSLIRQCHDTGAPVLRPLFYEFPDDKAAPTIDDQCLFGPSLLLAPVLTKGARSRDLYLPDALWTDFFTGERLAGPRRLTREAPLETLPMYVRDGAILFMWPALSWLDQRPVDRVFVDIYPPAKGASGETLYEDDGASEDYRNGVFCRRRFEAERTAAGLRVRVLAREGGFTPPPRVFILRLRLEGRPEEATLDGKKLAVVEAVGPESAPPSEAAAIYSAADGVLRVTFRDDGGGHGLELLL